MSNVDHAATRDDVFSWLHNMQHDDNPEYLAEAADLVLAAYDALQAERDEARKGLAASEARVERFERIARNHPTIVAMQLYPSGWMVTFDPDWDSSKAVDGMSRSTLMQAITTAHGDSPDEGEVTT